MLKSTSKDSLKNRSENTEKNLSRDFSKEASKNITKGLECEAMVRRELEKRGLQFFSQRFETPFAEVDLVFLKGRVVYFVEVKTYDTSYDLATRVTPKQVQRLQRAVSWWAARVSKSPCLLLAFVDIKRNHIILREPNYF